jgi:hypothetical protein
MLPISREAKSLGYFAGIGKMLYSSRCWELAADSSHPREA